MSSANKPLGHAGRAASSSRSKPPALSASHRHPSGAPERPASSSEALAQPTIDTYEGAIKVLKQANIIKKDTDVQNITLLVNSLRQHSCTMRQVRQKTQLQASDIDPKIYDALAIIIETHCNGYMSIHAALEAKFSQTLNNITTEIKGDLEKGLLSIKEVTMEAAQSVKDSAHQVHKTVTSIPSNSFSQQTYAAATRNGAQPKTAPVVLTAEDHAKLAADRRKVTLILEKDGTNIIVGKNNDELKKMATEALVKMEAPEEVRIRSTNVYLRSNTAVLEMWDDDSARWIKAGERAKTLATHLGSKISVPISWNIVNFVPVEFDIEGGLDELLEVNDIKKDELLKIQWMRNPINRKPGQKVASIKMAISDPLVANRLLLRGTIIHSTPRTTEKMEREPTKCFNCQGYGHMSRNCLKPEPICSNCAEEGHADTKATPCPNPSVKRCAVCNVDGHSAKDPRCPSKARKTEELSRRTAGYGTKYHFTDEPWTWVGKDDTGLPDLSKNRSYGHSYEGIEPTFRPNSQWREKQARKASQTQQEQNAAPPSPHQGSDDSNAETLPRRSTQAQPFPMSLPSQPLSTQPPAPTPSLPPGNQLARRNKNTDTFSDANEQLNANGLSWNETLSTKWEDERDPTQTQNKSSQINEHPQLTFPQ